MNFFTVNQLATRWHVHPITIRRYIREGKLKAKKIGGSIRISKKAAQDMANTISPFPRRSAPPHLSHRPHRRAFSDTDPLWRFKGLGFSQEAI
ncbi:MAG: helix-turn-helix domain-containing protein [Deltaproteobacteria bacterium]|nr:helix-turn-helix domain-containing protein [Candidatus Chisholmbacteria bacterium]MBI4224635.1 helix-turn-helix domain-containing protein [Deltaproteobacteria bacterium]